MSKNLEIVPNQEWLHLISDLFIFIGMYVYLHVYLCTTYVCLLPTEGIVSLGIRVVDGCELLCMCWELNPSHLEEQPVLLTDEPSFLPKVLFCTACAV